MTKYVFNSLMAILAVGLMGCGQGFQVNGAGSTGGALNNGEIESTTGVDVQNEMLKAEAAAKEAELAINEVNALLAEITDKNGNVNIGFFQKSETQTKGILDPILAKLRTKFNELFAKVVAVKAKFTEARAQLNAALAKLDQNDPAQALLYQQVKSQLVKVDAMEAQFSASMHTLAGKLDLVTVALQKLISGVTSFIPGFGWVVDLAIDFLLMGDVKAFIAEVKAQLLAL